MKKTKKIVSTPIVIGILLFIVSIAVMSAILHYISHDENSKFNKADIFDSILETNMEETTVSPGESFSAVHVIVGQATVNQYVFIEITTPSVNGEPLYTLERTDGWTFMESTSGENKLVYAYALGGVMTELTCDERNCTVDKRDHHTRFC